MSLWTGDCGDTLCDRGTCWRCDSERGRKRADWMAIRVAVELVVLAVVAFVFARGGR